MITLASLIGAGIGPTQARLFVDPLSQACEIYQISSPLRQAAFIAECAIESSLFVHQEESLFYRDAARVVDLFRTAFDSNKDGKAEPAEIAEAQRYVSKPGVSRARELANRAYAGRNGNGDEASGDGWRFRGRGLIQLTGRNNYTAAALRLAEPYVDQPDLVASPADACLTAGWFWDRNSLNKLADTGSIDLITRAVNGSRMVAAKERRDLFRVLFTLFGATPAAAAV